MAKKIALVSGGMGGIGSAICKELYKQQCTVVSTYIQDHQKAQDWLNKCEEDGFKFYAYQCDVKDYHQCQHLAKLIKQDLGTVDILVNNAGITRDSTLRKMTKDMWDDVLSTNLDSVFNMTKNFIDDMITKEWGRIINISSVNGQKGQLGQANYSATKAGVHGFTMAVAQEVAKKGITVNTIAPGYVATDMVMAVPEEIRAKIVANIPIGRLGRPEEIASLVGYIASDVAGFITGAELSINGGQHMM